MSRTTQHGGQESSEEESRKEVVAFPVHPCVSPLDLAGPLTVPPNRTTTPHRTASSHRHTCAGRLRPAAAGHQETP
jgi:hypothetical protein